MADAQVEPPLFTALETNVAIQTFLQRHRAQLIERQRHITIDETLDTPVLDYAVIGKLLQTAANGVYDLPEQQVEVEYLKQDQRLLIPAGLAMSAAEGVAGLVPLNRGMMERLQRLANIPYATLRDWVNERRTAAQMVARIDATELLAAFTYPHAWDVTLGDGVVDDPMHVSLVYGVMSQVLQLNFDVRDVGALLPANMRIADNAWMDISQVPKDRLLNKLQAWTLTCLATLNMPACQNFALGAWVRAYGVGCGFLPAINSLSRREYAFTNRLGRNEDRTAVTAFETAYSDPLHQLSINVISMFGIFHLGKDHTFRSGDVNMERIGTAYINAMRTNVANDYIEMMQTNKEVTVRTAAHPFGLAQTYFVAKVAANHNVLAEPLRIRINVTPPPVQRLMVVQAAQTEWSSLPVGVELNDIYANHLEAIDTEIAQIQRSPPAYSSLYKLYGLTERSVVAQHPAFAAASMMPMVYGFAEAVHVDEGNKRDGIALALSLLNVARDHKALASIWTNMWRGYLEGMDKQGILDFARSSRRTYIPGATAN